MTSAQCRHRGGETSLHKGDASRARHRVGGGVGETQGVKHRIGVEAHHSTCSRPKGRRVVGAEQPVQTRSPSKRTPVGEVAPVATSSRPARLTRVHQSAHTQESDSNIGRGSVEGARVGVGNLDAVGEGSEWLAGGKVGLEVGVGSGGKLRHLVKSEESV